MMTPHIQAYLEEAITILHQHALRKTALDWESVRRDVLAQSATLTTIPDTYPTIRQLIHELGDHHSYFLAPQAMQRELDGQAYQVGIVAAHPTGVVIQVLPGSPAAAADIHVGDIVAAINGVAVADWEADAFSATLLASEVVLMIDDAGNQVRRSLTLAAASFPLTTEPRGQILSSVIGYLDVPAMHGPAALAQSYAERLQAAIRTADLYGVRGWIVDLRRNTGGNMWPMLAGLGPLLGTGDLGAFVYPDGEMEQWTYQQGKVALDGWTMAQIAHPYTLQQAAPPVAILLSRYTRSSGELAALAFNGVPRTRSFGEATAGVPTSTAPFALSDGALIVLTVARGADRNGQAFDAPLIPDQPTPNDWQQFGTADDPVMLAATTWLTATI